MKNIGFLLGLLVSISALAQPIILTTPYTRQVLTSTNALQGRDLQGLLKAVNVQWFGALGNGKSNDTAAVKAAYDYAITNGQVLYFPQTRSNYLFNLVVTNSMRFIGDRASGPAWSLTGSSGSDGSTVSAYDASQPIFKVGGLASAQIYGVTFEDIAFYGGTNTGCANPGNIAIHFDRGAWYGAAKDCLFRWFTNAVLFYPVETGYGSMNSLQNCRIFMPGYGADTRGVVVRHSTTNTTWMTGTSICGNSHIWNIAGHGYSLEVDGAPVWLNNMYLDQASGHGVLIKETPGATNPNYGRPQLWCQTVMFDGSGGAYQLIKLNDTPLADFDSFGSWMKGDYYIMGSWVTSDNVVVPNYGNNSLTYRTELSSPVITDRIFLRNHDSSGPLGDDSVSVLRYNNNLYLHSPSSIFIGGGGYHYMDATNSSYVVWRSTVHGKFVSSGVDTNGDWYIRNSPGRDITVQNSSGSGRLTVRDGSNIYLTPDSGIVTVSGRVTAGSLTVTTNVTSPAYYLSNTTNYLADAASTNVTLSAYGDILARPGSGYFKTFGAAGKEARIGVQPGEVYFTSPDVGVNVKVLERAGYGYVTAPGGAAYYSAANSTHRMRGKLAIAASDTGPTNQLDVIGTGLFSGLLSVPSGLQFDAATQYLLGGTNNVVAAAAGDFYFYPTGNDLHVYGANSANILLNDVDSGTVGHIHQTGNDIIVECQSSGFAKLYDNAGYGVAVQRSGPIYLEAGSGYTRNIGKLGVGPAGFNATNQLDVIGDIHATGVFINNALSGISATIDALVAGSTTNRLVFSGGILISNITGFYSP